MNRSKRIDQTGNVGVRRASKSTQFDLFAGCTSVFVLADILLIGAIVFCIAYLIPTQLSSSSPTNSSAKNVQELVRRLHFSANGEELWIHRGSSQIIKLDLTTRRVQRISKMDGRTIEFSNYSRDSRVRLLLLDGCNMCIYRDNELIVYDKVIDSLDFQVALSSDGRTAVRILNGTLVKAWDLSNVDPASVEYELAAPADGIALDPTGETLITSSTQGVLRFYDAKTGDVSRKDLVIGTAVRTFSISEDGQWLIIVRWGSLALYNFNSCELIWRQNAAESDTFFSAKFSPDGNWIAAFCQTGGLQILDRESGKICHQLSTNSADCKSAFSASSDKFYLVNIDSSISVWALSDWREIERWRPSDF